DGCLIDFHSGNNFSPQYGLSNCATQYLEHFPYIDSLWFGEGFDYDESPDYWLVEISGIPFGLFGEMLQNNGNPWRGMIYGMTNRLGWGGDPRNIWKLWDEFGIQDSQMIGYWDKNCPVKTDNKNVLATVYRKTEKSLVSIASWAKELTNCKLDIDWKTLGLDEKNSVLDAPAIEGFQPSAIFRPSDKIPIEPGRGWLLIIRKQS
ncbi:MAG: glycoside hydrolase domain-containing protein, partial [Candidatus Poribacteria bacterium]